jgi:hypothetical protein
MLCSLVEKINVSEEDIVSFFELLIPIKLVILEFVVARITDLTTQFSTVQNVTRVETKQTQWARVTAVSGCRRK